jgi:hypothetical protein
VDELVSMKENATTEQNILLLIIEMNLDPLANPAYSIQPKKGLG